MNLRLSDLVNGADIGASDLPATVIRKLQSVIDKRTPTPESAPSTPQPGLYVKFEVRRVDGTDAAGGKRHGCDYFVCASFNAR
jgi:hypothetical protein